MARLTEITVTPTWHSAAACSSDGRGGIASRMRALANALSKPLLGVGRRSASSSVLTHKWSQVVYNLCQTGLDNSTSFDIARSMRHVPACPDVVGDRVSGLTRVGLLLWAPHATDSGHARRPVRGLTAPQTPVCEISLLLTSRR